MPRPKNPPRPPRRELTKILATEEEEERIKAAAGRAGEPVALFVRRALWARVEATEQ